MMTLLAVAGQTVLAMGTAALVAREKQNLTDLKASRREDAYAFTLNGGHMEAHATELKLAGAVTGAVALSALLWRQLV